jgi:hypothetical protein
MKDRGGHIRRALVASARQWWGIVVLLGVLAVAAYLARDIPNYPTNQLDTYRNTPAIATALAAVEPKDRLAAEKDLLQYQTDNQIKIWTSIVQAIGAVVLAVGGYFTWRNLRVAQEGQITNRFTQAIDQLGVEKEGEPNLEVRLGAIYALERIARDSPRDHWTIMEVLTTYVRQNAPWPPSPSSRSIISPWRARHEREVEGPDKSKQVKPRADIQAILTVLGRRTPPRQWPELGPLDLSRADLGGANLWRGNLRGAALVDANLQEADLKGVNLQKANLVRANLQKAVLMGVNLQEAALGGANLQGAFLWGANLQGAILVEANLQEAALTGANLQGAFLLDANLQGAFLMRANLQGANLGGANLQRASLNDADLSTANNLSENQVKSAASRKGAKFPAELAYLQEPAGMEEPPAARVTMSSNESGAATESGPPASGDA